MVAIASVYSEKQKVPPQGNAPLKTWYMHAEAPKSIKFMGCAQKKYYMGCLYTSALNPAVKPAHGVPQVSTVSLMLGGVLVLV